MNKIIERKIRLAKEDWDAIDSTAERLNLSRSGALRLMIRSWKARSAVLAGLIQDYDDDVDPTDQ